jgi:hypothetical protein
MLILPLFFLLAAAEPSVSGEWSIHRSAAGNESTQTCHLTQTGPKLTGTCESQKGPVQITGKIEGAKATWTFQTDRDGSPLTIIYKGTVESATKMNGSVTAVEFGIEGEFTATKK